MSNVMEYYERLCHCPTCKKVKALEIIKPYISLAIFKDDNYSIYLLCFDDKNEVIISKEQYELLNEVLS